MKKLINDADNVMTESLRGFAAAHRDIVLLSQDPTFVARRKNAAPGKVALVSGGGSGHGRCMPASSARTCWMPPVRPCLHLAAAETDILWIVKNYAGDIMNVEMAAEMFDGERATVPTNDDVAVEDSLHSQGRHGVAGTDVGAAAEHATISNAAERSRRGSMRHPAPSASLS